MPVRPHRLLLAELFHAPRRTYYTDLNPCASPSAKLTAKPTATPYEFKMAVARLLRPPNLSSQLLNPIRWPNLPSSRCLTQSQCRTFTSTRVRFQHSNQHRKQSFRARLRLAWKNTRVQWYTIPVGVGIAFLGATHLYHVAARERERMRREEEERDSAYGSDEDTDGQPGQRPKRRPRIKPSGPWTVQVMSTLPLKALSRLWGRFNEIPLPYWFRVPGFKLYSWIFGVNLSEVEQDDLHVYPNLAAFFYRRLKPGVRPLDPNPNAVLSPSDGKIIQFGTIEHGEVEQVKGVTYSLDALLGSQSPGSQTSSRASTPPSSPELTPIEEHPRLGDEDIIRADEEFAKVNGISYTLPSLLSGGAQAESSKREGAKTVGDSNSSLPIDQSTTPKPSSEAEVRADLALAETNTPWWAPRSKKTQTVLYYCVVYLAPGDYHRFHSPVSWVVTSRRHFAGELYSVSPYLQRTLPGLFTLNERVVLLGRWRWGFFSYTPVGATNVGSIVVNFDRELRTNSLTTDTEADRRAERAASRAEPYAGFAEATYENASAILHGYALKRGEEMGGFQLGSTIVLVFEAPKGRRSTSLDQGWVEDESKLRGWKWNVEKGQKIKMGQSIGEVVGGDES